MVHHDWDVAVDSGDCCLGVKVEGSFCREGLTEDHNRVYVSFLHDLKPMSAS